MRDERVRIVDIAEELGLSTATVSNVIHGKTKKISDETVKRVQALLEEKQYIPSMAGILLAQNNSRIIGVVVNDHEKYEGRVLEDGFIASCLNSLSAEIDRNGYFMMVKVTKQWNEISRFASMWNMEGLVIMGFCGQDYKKLRETMHIPFVVYDGFYEEAGKMANISVDDFGGGVLAGSYLRSKGHRKILCISDNESCMDLERYQGLQKTVPEAKLLIVPMKQAERFIFYEEKLAYIRKFTAIFAVSDYYAADIIKFLKGHRISIPEELSVMGFDNTDLGKWVQPSLTTIGQDSKERAREALRLLKKLKAGQGNGETVKISVSLVERDSVAKYTNSNH